MKLLVIGSGGREHALAWCLAKTPGLQKIFVAPGNAGTAHEHGIQNIDLSDPLALADFAEKEKIELTVVGPEAPLAAGIVNLFRARGLKIFGPTKEAAQLESSKDFAKRFMVRHKIPTAAFETFSDATAAHAYVEGKGAPIVIKADGLAAGKGVVVALSLDEAHRAIDDMLSYNQFGEAGARIVIEEFLEGEEASFIVMVDGRNVLALASSQDHKRIGDGDCGPNTGGMGAYSPAPVVTPDIHAKTMREIILPTVRGMAADGMPYTGFLYAGLMIGKEGSVKTVEFNCRMGDPETQPIIMRLKSDLFTLLEHAVAGKLCWRRPTTRTCRAWAIRSAAFRRRVKTRMFFTPARQKKTARWLPPVAACYVSPRWAITSSKRKSTPTTRCSAFTSTACNAAATLAIERLPGEQCTRCAAESWRNDCPSGTQSLFYRPATKHRCCGRGTGRP
jgi:phosphoribosylamine--glycine ligase